MSKNLFVDLGGFRLTADFEIDRGSLISIVGPSGAGKSTILNALAGFIPLTSGVIKWNGSDITKLDPGLRPLSILFQDYNLFSHLTVKDNIAIGLRPNLKLDDLETEMVNSVIEEVGLSKFKFIKPFQLSGGQRTRVSLARSIVRSKPILLLDDVLAELDPSRQLLLLDAVGNDHQCLISATHLSAFEGDWKEESQILELRNNIEVLDDS